MTYNNILNDLKNKKYKPVYLLMGDEPYFIDIITEFVLKNILNESEKAFNQSVFYGKDTEAATIINAAKRFPMMSEYQLIVVKEAQHIKNIEDLHYYTDNPLKSTILVLCYKYKNLDKRKKLYKSIENAGIIFESKKLYEDKIPMWIDSYIVSKNYKIDPQAAVLLTEFLGSDLSKIAHEINKLILTLTDGEKKITALHIETNIGISKDFNNLELQKAIVTRDTLKAFRIVNYFDKNQNSNPFVLTITSLYFFFSKVLLLCFLKDKSNAGAAKALQINPFFVKEYKEAASVYPPSKLVNIISLLREYDLKAKGVGNISTGPGELLKELVSKIMN